MFKHLSRQVTITFTPKLNEDIFEELPVLAQTGPMSVPIQCLIKRTVISTDPSTGRLDFGMVTRAEKGVKTLLIENRGALPTTFELEEQRGEEPREDSVLRWGFGLRYDEKARLAVSCQELWPRLLTDSGGASEFVFTVGRMSTLKIFATLRQTR
jgi:hypothetical protein